MAERCRRLIAKSLKKLTGNKHNERQLDKFLNKMLDQLYTLKPTNRKLQMIKGIMEEEGLDSFTVNVKHFLRLCLFDY
jgi:hypothetical protein